MAERACAMQSKAYLALREAYVNKDEAVKSLREKCKDKRIAWTVGSNVPDELLIAAGMIPVRAYGDHAMPRVQADRYLEASFSSLWCGLFEKIVGGKCRDVMDLLVFSNTNIMIEKLCGYIKALAAAEPGLMIPPVMYFEQELFNPQHVFFKRNVENFNYMKDTLERAYGWRILDDELRAASLLCNKNRAALRAFAELRKAPNCCVTGTEALTVIGASLLMPKAESTALILEVTKDAENWDTVNAVPVYYTGTMQETGDVYALIEEAGGNVVAEDHDWGNRHFDNDVDLNGQYIDHAITARYMYKYANSERGLVRNRKKAVPERAREAGAEKFLLYMNANDEAFLWDYPSQKPYFDELGIKTHVVSKQKYPIENTEALKAELAGFIS